jgi:hypothetical protein
MRTKAISISERKEEEGKQSWLLLIHGSEYRMGEDAPSSLLCLIHGSDSDTVGWAGNKIRD